VSYLTPTYRDAYDRQSALLKRPRREAPAFVCVLQDRCLVSDSIAILALVRMFWRSVNQNCFRNYYNVRVIIGSDHARYEPNKQLVRFGREAGCEFVDVAPEETF
jgi:hypothetical protein